VRRGPLISLIAVAALGAAAAGFAWHRATVRRTAALVRAAVPPPPDLAAWPEEYASRLRAAMAAANRLDEPRTALKEIACLYHANGYYREAEQAERGLHALEPKNALWTCYLADACQNLGDQDGTRTFLEETIRLAPYYAPAHLKLADLLFKQGQADAAVAQYELRLTLVPQDPYARLGLARIALQRGDRTGALKYLEATVRDSPDFPSAHNLLAVVYDQMGETAKAAEQRGLGTLAGRFREVDDPWINRIYGWTFDVFRLEVLGANRLQTRQLDASLPFYEKAVRLAPHDGMAYDALGDVYRQLNRLDEAQATFEAGIAAAPKTEALYVSLAGMRRKQGQPSEAIAALRRGVQALPRRADLRIALGAALEEADRRAEAAAAYRVAVRLEPHSASAHTSLGLCLLSLGLLREGREQLEQAIAISSGGPEVRQALQNGLARARAANDQASVSTLEPILAKLAP
jgi:tetratricopeptide (TPR) repeat protein